MAEIVMDATNVSQEILVWLMKAKDGHYFIKRCPNRSSGTECNYFRVPESLAIKWIRLPVEDAWVAMEKYVGAAQI